MTLCALFCIAPLAIGSPQASAAANAWPAGMAPSEAPVFQRNELVTHAPPERVFAWLARADLWASYYDNAHDVRVQAPAGRPLGPGTRFHWWTFGIPLDSHVALYEPARALAWEADTPGLRAYHKWILLPQGTGTRIITEETDEGPLARLGAWFIRDGLKREHQRWLEGLDLMARSGFPPSR